MIVARPARAARVPLAVPRALPGALVSRSAVARSAGAPRARPVVAVAVVVVVSRARVPSRASSSRVFVVARAVFVDRRADASRVSASKYASRFRRRSSDIARALGDGARVARCGASLRAATRFESIRFASRDERDARSTTRSTRAT